MVWTENILYLCLQIIWKNNQGWLRLANCMGIKRKTKYELKKTKNYEKTTICFLSYQFSVPHCKRTDYVDF